MDVEGLRSMGAFFNANLAFGTDLPRNLVGKCGCSAMARLPNHEKVQELAACD